MGVSHRIDFQAFVGASCWLYPQTEVFVDLHGARTRDGSDLRYGLATTKVVEFDDVARVRYQGSEGEVHEVEGDLVVGADGSRGSARGLVEDRHQYFREYPYAWFGVLVQAPTSAPELIYARSPHGFALVSQRTSDIQRLYFQCNPTEDQQSWSDDRIWEQLQLRLGGEDGFRLHEGPVIERTVLPLRSFVQTPLRHPRLLLAGAPATPCRRPGPRGSTWPWPTYVLWRR